MLFITTYIPPPGSTFYDNVETNVQLPELETCIGDHLEQHDDPNSIMYVVGTLMQEQLATKLAEDSARVIVLKTDITLRGDGLAQWLERWTGDPKVEGSNPVRSQEGCADSLSVCPTPVCIRAHT